MVFRQAIDVEDFRIAAINARYPAETLAHLIRYDSIHGKFLGNVDTEEDALIVNGKRVQIVNERNPANLPWKELGVDIVIEATGKFNARDQAALHLQAGAKKVILTAPGKNEDVTVVVGVNEDTLNINEHDIISNASCTTNCLAPVVKVLDERFGIIDGFMTTVHAFTNDQKNLDNPHKDLRRARACGESIIPTTTGAAKAIGKVLPHLQGKLHGLAMRVPVPNVSLVDLVCEVKQPVTVEEINRAFEEASENELKNILNITYEPLVSKDFITDPHSAIVDGLSTMVLEDRKVKVLAWYDNEWGYSARVVDLLKLVVKEMNKSLQTTALS